MSLIHTLSGRRLTQWSGIIRFSRKHANRSSSVATSLMLLFGFAAATLDASPAHADTATWSVATPVVYANVPAGSNHDDVLKSVSCSATSSCTAVGSVETTNGTYQAFATTETSGVYNAGQVAQFGVGVQSASPYAKFQSVSCSSAGNCTAVGDFATLTGGYATFADTQVNGAWQTAQPMVFGSGVQDTPPYADFASIACSSPGNCSAVGTYRDPYGNADAFVVSDVNFVWQTAVPVNFASGVQDATPDAPMSSVSCSSAGNCAAVGQFQDSSGNYEALWVNEVQGTWVQAVPALFSGGVQNVAPDAYFDSVSCQSDGNCTAVGQLEDASGNFVAFGDSETNFMPTQGSEVTFASNAQQSVELSNFTSVSCSSAGNCTGVGQYVDSAGDQEAFSETQSNNWWGTAQPAIFVYGTQNNVPDEQFDSVACVSVGNCTAAGQFYDLNGNYQGFVSTLSNGNWQTPQVLNFGGGVENSSPNVQTLSISCSNAGNCSTVGRFLDAGGQNEAFTASSVAMATTPSSTGSPSNVTATISNSSATVSWTPTGVATSYTVTASQGDLTCTTTRTSCVIAGLTSDTTYTFNVVAHNADSSSNAGVSDWAKTLKGSLARPAVVHFTSFSGRGNNIVVVITNEPVGHTTWTSYAYYLSTTKKWVNTTLSSSHAFAIHHLTKGAAYGIRLRARNSKGLGPSSPLETVLVH